VICTVVKLRTNKTDVAAELTADKLGDVIVLITAPYHQFLFGERFIDVNLKKNKTL
jgi:hypothetical protein